MAPLDATISQALSDYESKHCLLPRGWLPFALTEASPSLSSLTRSSLSSLTRSSLSSLTRSSLSSLTRSSLSSALRSSTLWSSFQTPRATLAQAAKTNPTMLGDPVSLKAEPADSSPTDQDRGAASPASDAPRKQNWGSQPPGDPPARTKMQQKSLKQAAKENVTQLGDPVSLKAETADSEPTADDRGAGGENKRVSGGGNGASGGSGKEEEPPEVDVEEVWKVVEKARGGKAKL